MAESASHKTAFDHFQAGRFEAARALLTRLVAREPDNLSLRAALTATLHELGQFAAAEFHARHAYRAAPDDFGALFNLARVLMPLGRAREAQELLKEALEIDPRGTVARAQLINLHLTFEENKEAIEQCKLGMEHDPRDLSIGLLLASAYRKLGKTAEAREVFTRLRWEHGDNPEVWAATASFLNYDPQATPEEVTAAHRQYGLLVAQHAERVRFEHPVRDDPARPLRIGLVSHDFHAHSVSFFVEPFLRHADRANFAYTLYHTSTRSDIVTDRLKALADRFRSMPQGSSPVVAQRVYDDKIDILIDLSGITMGHRLHAMQLRPAPVQFTYIGYPATTGIPNIDYRIVDSLTDPPGAESFATERLLRLDPCFLCCVPAIHRSDVVPPDWKPPPPDHNPPDRVLFGSFNAAMKLNDPQLTTWARLLRTVPGSRLLIKAAGLEGTERASDILQLFEREGVDRGRVEMRGWAASGADHLGMYQRVDVALDTYPYNGTTTTCEALAMGTPVVTLAGRLHAGRVGVSLLTNAGRPEWIARDEDEYVSIAAALAGDREKRVALRDETSAKFLASAICDGPGHARRLEAAFREAWRRRCGE